MLEAVIQDQSIRIKMLNRPLTSSGANRVTNHRGDTFQFFSKPEGFITRLGDIGQYLESVGDNDAFCRVFPSIAARKNTNVAPLVGKKATDVGNQGCLASPADGDVADADYRNRQVSCF